MKQWSDGRHSFPRSWKILALPLNEEVVSQPLNAWRKRRAWSFRSQWRRSVVGVGGDFKCFPITKPDPFLEAVHFVKVFTKIRGQNPGLGQTYVYLLSLCHIASAIQDSHSDLPFTVLSSREPWIVTAYRCFNQCFDKKRTAMTQTYRRRNIWPLR